MVDVFDLRVVDAPFDSGLGGRLLIRLSDLGGCGNELMLTVFLSVLPAPLIADTERGWGSAVVGAGVAGGRKVVEGARSPLLGVVGVAAPFLVLPTGRAGRAALGGPLEGRDALGSVVVMTDSFRGLHPGERKRQTPCTRPTRLCARLIVPEAYSEKMARLTTAIKCCEIEPREPGDQMLLCTRCARAGASVPPFRALEVPSSGLPGSGSEQGRLKRFYAMRR